MHLYRLPEVMEKIDGTSSDTKPTNKNANNIKEKIVILASQVFKIQ